MTVSAEAVHQRRASVGSRAWAAVRRHTLTVYAILGFAYLLLPIAVVILFSFNDPAGRFNYVWSGFTLDNYGGTFPSQHRDAAERFAALVSPAAPAGSS